jgi:hypothetical protein
MYGVCAFAGWRVRTLGTGISDLKLEISKGDIYPMDGLDTVVLNPRVTLRRRGLQSLSPSAPIVDIIGKFVGIRLESRED